MKLYTTISTTVSREALVGFVILLNMLTVSHKSLEVYKQAMSMTIIAYELTSHFPDSEKYGITSQIRRAAVSVVSNIAEGSARRTGNERRRFYEISRSSLVELDTQFEISTRLGFCTKENTILLENSVLTAFKLLSGMIRSC